MRNWKVIAQAVLPNPPEELDRVCAPLDGLEEVFRPLSTTLTSDVEPLPVVRALDDSAILGK